MKSLALSLLITGVLSATVIAQESATDEAAAPTALNFTMQTIEGEDKVLGDYLGQVVVVVNVASRCGLTPQYEKLQSLHEKYSEQGLAILGFPCNQFAEQEPGSNEEIATFCRDNYNVGFDMFSKIDVNGDDSCELYQHLRSLEIEPAGTGDIKWNFEKFVLDREGNVIARFGPRTDPMSDEFVAAIEKALGSE
ncbi:MAG: glutathione peroxidase [Pirellulaceae bacterium]